MRTPRLLALLVLVPLALAAGCGDAKPAATTQTAATGLTADEWRTRADAICTEYDAKLEAIPSPTGPADVAAYFEKVLPLAKEGN